MKHASVLVPNGNTVVDTVIASYNLMKMAESYYRKNVSKGGIFHIDLVGESAEPVTYQNLFSLQPTATLNKVGRTDLIIVSPISGNLEKEIANNAGFVSWIRRQRIEHGAELASLCKGAFLLAETGLLNGKTCSTHWTAHDAFRARYPKVKLVPESIISEDNGIYSSGGAYSILNFMLFLIEKYYGRQTAIYISKLSEIDIDRFDQSPFTVFNGQKDHSDEAVKKAQIFIENNYAGKLTIDDLARQVHVSSRSFLRRFKKATYNTPLEYVQRVKIEAAKKLLESTADTVLEVMYAIGYQDEKAFRNAFRKYSGLSPNDYRKKYNREMAMV